MSENKQVKSAKKAWWADSLALFTSLSLWIAFPVILASLIGNYLDTRYNTAPLILLICVAFSFVLTMIVLVKKTLKTFREIEQDEKKNKKNKNVGL